MTMPFPVVRYCSGFMEIFGTTMDYNSARYQYKHRFAGVLFNFNSGGTRLTRERHQPQLPSDGPSC